MVEFSVPEVSFSKLGTMVLHWDLEGRLLVDDLYHTIYEHV